MCVVYGSLLGHIARFEINTRNAARVQQDMSISLTRTKVHPEKKPADQPTINSEAESSALLEKEQSEGAEEEEEEETWEQWLSRIVRHFPWRSIN